MKQAGWISATLAIAFGLAACASPGTRDRPPLAAAPSVDLERFMGTWHVIANVPYFFENGKVDTLVATDVAARGIDVADVTHVINYDMPEDTDTFVHRVGRTGRAGATGVGISFVLADQSHDTRKLAHTLGLKQEFEASGPPVMTSPAKSGQGQKRGGGQGGSRGGSRNGGGPRSENGRGSRGGSSRSGDGQHRKQGRSGSNGGNSRRGR